VQVPVSGCCGLRCRNQQALSDSGAVQSQKLAQVVSQLRRDLESAINAQQDKKLAELDTSLKRIIQQVASAPVEVSLSDEAKRGITANLERRVAKLEAR
jgi:BMFP domain-containing protein YqiC